MIVANIIYDYRDIDGERGSGILLYDYIEECLREMPYILWQCYPKKRFTHIIEAIDIGYTLLYKPKKRNEDE